MQALEEVSDYCPHCGEPITLLTDFSGGSQSWVEDCQVCCQPIHVDLWISEQDWRLLLRREQD